MYFSENVSYLSQPVTISPKWGTLVGQKHFISYRRALCRQSDSLVKSSRTASAFFKSLFSHAPAKCGCVHCGLAVHIRPCKKGIITLCGLHAVHFAAALRAIVKEHLYNVHFAPVILCSLVYRCAFWQSISVPSHSARDNPRQSW